MIHQYSEKFPIVFIRDEGVMGLVIKMGAHASLVRFAVDGIEHEVWLENDEFVLYENIIINYEDIDE